MSQRLRTIRLLADMEAQDAEDDLVIAELNQYRRHRRGQAHKRFWIRPWLQRRDHFGHYERLMHELATEDRLSFVNFLRVSPEMFGELEQRLSERLTKTDTWFRNALKPGLKLAITLRYLATGDSYKSLMYGFRVPHNSISLIVLEVCKAIFDEFSGEVITCPTTKDEWRDVAQQFGARWNFHHALGAIDGKHIAIKAPKNSGSLYHNYKGFFSIVMLALVDADYKFLWVEVGANGSASDAQVFNSSQLKEAIDSGEINFPEPEPLPHDDNNLPYFLVGDDAFALRTWMMKPFSKRNMSMEERIFNYRLSRSRRVVENAFGILANRFQCLLTTMRQKPETVQAIVLACCCLHNLMRVRYPTVQNAVMDQADENDNIIPGEWRNGFIMHDLGGHQRGNVGTRAAQQQREYLKLYYNSQVGEVPWQYKDLI